MAITLSTMADLTSPVSFSENRAFGNNYGIVSKFSRKEQLILTIQGLIYGESGTIDYRSDHPLLRQDALRWAGGISRFNSDVARAVSAWKVGQAVVGGISTNIPTLLAAAKSFYELPEEDLEKVINYLTYQIS
jgi:hypothetical protein